MLLGHGSGFVSVLLIIEPSNSGDRIRLGTVAKV